MSISLHKYKQKILNRVARTSLGKSFFGNISRHPLDDKQWVFILGCYNSGTTLLQRLMLSHPDIAGMPAEGVAFTDVLTRPEEYGWPRMWLKCRDQIKEGSNYTKTGARRLKSQWSWLLDKPEAPVILEKSIVNVVHAPFFNKYFGRPKFIHLVRNGYAVSEGIRRKATPSRWGNPVFENEYPINLCAAQWTKTLEAIDTLKNDDFDILEVTYEKLSNQPDATLREIFSFIGLDSLNQNVQSKSWLVHGSVNKVQNMNAKSIRSLSADDIEAIDSVTSHWISQYGYTCNN